MCDTIQASRKSDGLPTEETRRDAGFGGIKRLADLFDLYSQPNHGTAVVAHVGTVVGLESTCPCSGSALEAVGVVCVPARGEVTSFSIPDDWTSNSTLSPTVVWPVTAGPAVKAIFIGGQPSSGIGP